MVTNTGNRETRLGLIPKDWDVSTVNDSFEIHNHLRKPISQKVRETISGPFPYYGPTGAQGSINEYRVEGEYALIGEDGDHFLKWRDQTMTLLVRGRFNVNNHAHLIRGKKNLTQWFYYYFAHRDLTPYLTRQGAGRFKLTKQALIDLPCVVPPVAEQEAIVTALTHVDELLSHLHHVIEKTIALKQAVMQQLLTGQQRLPGFGGKWENKTLAQISTINPQSLGADTSPSYCFKYISLEDVDRGVLRSHTNQNFESAPSRARRILRKKDVLVANVRPNLKSHLLFKEDKADWVCSTGFSIVRCDSSKAYPDYVFYHLFAGAISRQIDSLVTGSNYPAINSSDVRSLTMPCPTVKEQQAIAEILTSFDVEILALGQRLEKTKLLKQGMMQELLSGRIRLV
jgi:type I restriction enzyme S subunit